jgi:hypothetical protein
VNPDTEQVGYHAQRVTKEQAARAEALVRRMCPDPDVILVVLGLVPAAPAEPETCRNGHPRTGENTRYRVKNGYRCKECVDCERNRTNPAPPNGYCRNGHLRTQENTRYDADGQVRCKDCRRDSDRRKRLQRGIVTES